MRTDSISPLPSTERLARAMTCSIITDLAGLLEASLRCPTLPQDEASITHSAPRNDRYTVAKNDRVGRHGAILRLTGEGLSWKGWETDFAGMKDET
jgi:hypothetical protein